jgi:hypothetical protein
MSAFADELRGTLAEQAAVTRAAQERQEQTVRQPRDEARAAAGKILDEVFEPLMEEFWGVMEAERVLRDGRLKRDARAASEYGVNLRALGIARSRRFFEIRLWCRATREAAIALSAECLHYYPECATRASDPQPLLPLPPAALSLSALSPGASAIDEARTWCRDILKQCAAALMDANFSGGPVGPAPIGAPLATFPADAPCDVPMTV